MMYSNENLNTIKDAVNESAETISLLKVALNNKKKEQEAFLKELYERTYHASLMYKLKISHKKSHGLQRMLYGNLDEMPWGSKPIPTDDDIKFHFEKNFLETEKEAQKYLVKCKKKIKNLIGKKAFGGQTGKIILFPDAKITDYKILQTCIKRGDKIIYKNNF